MINVSLPASSRINLPSLILSSKEFAFPEAYRFELLEFLAGYLLGISDEYNVCGGSLDNLRTLSAAFVDNLLRPSMLEISADKFNMARGILDSLLESIGNKLVTKNSFLAFWCPVSSAEQESITKPNFGYRTDSSVGTAVIESGNQNSLTQRRSFQVVQVHFNEKLSVRERISVGLMKLLYSSGITKFGIIRRFLNYRHKRRYQNAYASPNLPDSLLSDVYGEYSMCPYLVKKTS